MHKRSLSFIALLFTAAALPAAAAGLRPDLCIGEGCPTSWTDAIASGLLLPATGLIDTEERFARDQGVNAVFRAPNLYPDINVADEAGNSHQSLVMAWDTTGTDPMSDLVFSAWEYDYPTDPDLTGTRIHLSVYPPRGIWDVSFSIRDSSRRWRTWIIAGPAPTWAHIRLNPAIAGPQGPFTHFYEDAGFDLTMATRFRFDESGMNSMAFPIGPVPGLGGPVIWNSWNHFVVTPAPAVVALFGLGVAGLALARRRRAA
jgi:hypothetical protein